MTIYLEDPRAAAADIVFRRRALKVNSGIYARRHAPRLLPLLAGSGVLRARHIGQVAWLEAEHDWRAEDARRVSELAGDVVRFGNLRPALAQDCQWHADRLRELVRQHAALARLEAAHRPVAAWSAADPGKARRRGRSTRQKARGFLA